MEPLKDVSAATDSDEPRGSNTKIKEEILTSSEYNDLPGNSFPEEAATRCKDASKEEREFTVILDGKGGKHVVRGRLCDSVLTALRAAEDVRAWMDKKKTEEFYLIEKEKCSSTCINLGMPLKYVPEGSQFEMNWYKLKKNEKTDELWYRQYDDRNEECTLFYVYGSGSRMQTHGAQTRRIIRCSEVLTERCRFCIFAPKGESVRDAVCNDGRFLPILKQKNWVLVEGTQIRNNNFLVKNISGKCFEIHVETERGGGPNEKQTTHQTPHTKCCGGPNEKQNLLASSEVQLNAFEKQQQQDSEQGQLSTFKKQQHHHYCSEQGQLNSFKKRKQQQYFQQHLLDFYPKLKEQGEIIDKFLRGSSLQCKEKTVFEVYKRDFSKEINDSLSIKLMRTLASYSNSVGYIHWSSVVSASCATCFVLSGSYILTCHHVVKSIVGEGITKKDWGNRIKQSARVTFSYEEKHPSENNWFLFEDWFEISDEDLDFAVLKLEENESKSHPPPGLLQLRFPQPPDGPIFIIGHPSGETKSIDICLLISIFDRSRKCIDNWIQGQKNECCNSVCGYDRESMCIHMYNPKHFEGITNNPNVVTYNTSFFGGSSGSPVFNKHGQLVALHAAGYLYKMKNKDCSLIEFGYSIQSILLKIESKFKSWYDAIIAPVLLTSPDAIEHSSHVDTSLNEAEEMDWD